MQNDTRKYLKDKTPSNAEEWQRFYADRFNEIPKVKRLAVVNFMKNNLKFAIGEEDLYFIRNVILNDPENWKNELPFFHFSGGMAMRNWLRANGFNEKYMEIWNWDDYYIPVFEEAISQLYQVNFGWQRFKKHDE